MLHSYSETEFDWFFFPLGTLGLSLLLFWTVTTATLWMGLLNQINRTICLRLL